MSQKRTSRRSCRTLGMVFQVPRERRSVERASSLREDSVLERQSTAQFQNRIFDHAQEELSEPQNTFDRFTQRHKHLKYLNNPHNLLLQCRRSCERLLTNRRGKNFELKSLRGYRNSSTSTTKASNTKVKAKALTSTEAINIAHSEISATSTTIATPNRGMPSTPARQPP